MSLNEFISLNTSKDRELRMTTQLAVHCAPILKDVKVANIVTVAVEDFKGIGYLLRGTGISHRFLKTGSDKAILYLYRREKLKQLLADPEIQLFLEQYGYEGENVDAALDILSEHVKLYGSNEIAFPHEIGIFLGYPLWDVQGFLENEGRNFAYLGYWKVYRDVQGARKLFRRFDEKREQAIEELMLGKTLREIIQPSSVDYV